MDSIYVSEIILEDDLIWQYLSSHGCFKNFKRIVTFFLVFFLSITLLLPVNLIKMLSPLHTYVADHVEGVNFLSALITTYFANVVTLLINNTIIPLLITAFQAFEDYTRVSSRLRQMIARSYFFMLINLTFIPIMSAGTASEVVNRIYSKQVQNLPSLLSATLMSQQYQFQMLMIQLMTVTNGLSLVDAPHRIMRALLSAIHNFKQRNKVFKTAYVDIQEFPLAFNQSFVIIVFVNCLLFSSLAPTMPFFAFIYFFFKLIADKYNLIFTYYKK